MSNKEFKINLSFESDSKQEQIVVRKDRIYLIEIDLERLWKIADNLFKTRDARFDFLREVSEKTSDAFKNLNDGEAFVYFSPLVKVRELEENEVSRETIARLKELRDESQIEPPRNQDNEDDEKAV